MSETTWYEVVIVITYLVVIWFWWKKVEEEKRNMMKWTSWFPHVQLFFFFGFTNTFFGHHDKLQWKITSCNPTRINSRWG